VDIKTFCALCRIFHCQNILNLLLLYIYHMVAVLETCVAFLFSALI